MLPTTTDTLVTMVEQGYDNLMIFADYKTTVASLEVYEPALCLAEEYGISTMLSTMGEIGYDVPAGSKNPTWTVNDYDAAYGEAFDALETDSRVVGYFIETPTYIGSQWLRGITSKIMQYDYTCCTEGWAHYADIIRLYDEVADEAFDPTWATTDFPATIPTLYSIKPTLKIGVWDQTLNQWPNDWASYWTAEPWTLTPPPLPYATQQSRAITAFNAINAAMTTTFGHKLDFNVIQYSGTNISTVNESLTQAIEWHDAQHLTYTGTPIKPVQQMNQTGHIPAYGGAAICTYPATNPLVDTFANTGNEIIMLKSWSGSSSHTVTVSGTLPNGLTKTQSYTRTLSPNQGTPLGPFPVDQFGSNPTITYDNTNLYVSIVGESA